MSIFLIILAVLSGLAFIGSTLLMSPKGGLGLGLGGLGNSNEYGSKKSLEGKLKQVALVSGVFFLLLTILLPYTLRG